MRAGRVSHCSNPVRIDAVFSSVVPDKANRALDVLYRRGVMKTGTVPMIHHKERIPRIEKLRDKEPDRGAQRRKRRGIVGLLRRPPAPRHNNERISIRLCWMVHVPSSSATVPNTFQIQYSSLCPFEARPIELRTPE